MRFMFSYTTDFNQNISGWDTSNVTDMNSMFKNATAFNQDISGWDTCKVIDMKDIFSDAKNFDKDIKSRFMLNWNSCKSKERTSGPTGISDVPPEMVDSYNFLRTTNLLELSTVDKDIENLKVQITNSKKELNNLSKKIKEKTTLAKLKGIPIWACIIISISILIILGLLFYLAVFKNKTNIEGDNNNEEDYEDNENYESEDDNVSLE